MAWTVTGRGATEVAYTTGGDVGDTFTPSENDVICVAISWRRLARLDDISGWSATWHEIGNFEGAGGIGTSLWAARMGASPGSDVANINVTGSESLSAVVFQIAGGNTTAGLDSIGAGKFFVQSQDDQAYNASSPFSITALSAFADASNLSLTLGSISTNNNFTPQAGWTEAQQASLSTVSFNIAAMYKATAETLHTVEGTSFAFRHLTGVALECAIAPSVSGGGIRNPFGGPLSMRSPI